MAPPAPERKVLVVLDAMNFLYRAFHALPPLTSSRGVPTGAVAGLANMLLKIDREVKPTHACVVFDAPGKTFRDDIFAEYKAHRPPMPAELVPQVPMARRLLEAYRFAQLTVDGFEADDVIATLAKTATAEGQDFDVFIASSDKDLMQLVNDRVRILDTMKGRVFGPAEVKEKWGVPPERVGDLLALMGDNTDNVPGVAGIGPKTAAELVNRFGSLDDLLARAGEVKGKRGEALQAAHDVVRMSRALVSLRDDVPLPSTLDDLRRRPADREALIAVLRELEFSRLLDQALALQAGPEAPAPPLQLPLGVSPLHPAAASEPVAEAPKVQALAAEPRDAQIIADAAALDRLAQVIAAAPEVAIAYLADGPDAVAADIVGLAFALPDGTRAYLPLAHRYIGVPPTLRAAEALGRLGPTLAAEHPGKQVHDAKRLDVMLGMRGCAFAGLRGDPMIAAYLLDASRGRYDLDVLAAAAGVSTLTPRGTWLGTGKSARAPASMTVEDAARQLADEAWATLGLGAGQEARLVAERQASLYRDLELPLCHVLARVEARGVKLDVAQLAALGQDVSAQIAALEAEIAQAAGGAFNINSPKQLADVLFGKLGLPPLRKTKTGYSTDADVLEELAAAHPVPAKIVDYRALTKLKGTYIDALPALVNARTGRLHTTFNQTVAATGRLSSSDPNLQNIPIRTELGRRIRGAFVAEPGFRIVSADYSQIELRVLAHASGDEVLLDAFHKGQDVHQRTAAEVFGVAPEAVTRTQRTVAKAINFGLVFGQTDYGLARQLRIPRAQAKAYIESYFVRYAAVKTYMDGAIAEARRTGEVTTILGRRRPLPEIKAARAQDRQYAERIARNTPIQGSAADLLKLAMLEVDREVDRRRSGARLLLTVHDELVFEVPEAEIEPFCAWVKPAMEGVMRLRVPLVVDVKSGANWGEAH